MTKQLVVVVDKKLLIALCYWLSKTTNATTV